MNNKNTVYTITFSYTNYYNCYDKTYTKVAKTKEKAIQIMHQMLQNEREEWLNEKLTIAEVDYADLSIGPTSISYTDSSNELYIVVREAEIE